MEFSFHDKFICDLRTPVKEYEQKIKEQRRSKLTKPQSDKTSQEEADDLIYEVEALFDELFGSLDDNISSQQFNYND